MLLSGKCHKHFIVLIGRRIRIKAKKPTRPTKATPADDGIKIQTTEMTCEAFVCRSWAQGKSINSAFRVELLGCNGGYSVAVERAIVRAVDIERCAAADRTTKIAWHEATVEAK